MSTPITVNPSVEPKASKQKKKGKSEIIKPAPEVPSRSPSIDLDGGARAATNGAENGSESPYMKELSKNIRNVRKKLNATQKVDSIMAENPGMTLDELLASRKINPDQKAQAQKKPALQASLSQLEEQVEQYKKFDEDYQKRMAAEKIALESAHQDEMENVRSTTVAAAKAEAQKEAKDNLLILSKFLRAAASKRQDGDETAPENRAFEGALLLVYGGDANAVQVMEKLIDGSEENVPATDGTVLEVTYKTIRDASAEHSVPAYAAEEAWVDEVAQADPIAPPEEAEPPATTETPTDPASDPTVLHAGLTEIDAENVPLTNGTSNHVETPTVPEGSNIDAGAANAAAAVNWEAKVDTNGEGDLEGQTELPRDAAETDTGIDATPAALTSTQSWAEEIPQDPTPQPSIAPTGPSSDGFHEVTHGRGRGRGGGQSEYRGRGGRSGYRGDRGGEGGYRGRGGYRGDRRGDGEYRGRGRGGPRGGGRGRGDSQPRTPA